MIMRYFFFFINFLIIGTSFAHETGTFHTHGPVIHDPYGDEFITKGANRNGGIRNDWCDDFSSDIDCFVDLWQFNAVRVTNRLWDSYWNGNLTSNCTPVQNITDLPSRVQKYTDRGVVVILDWHAIGDYATFSASETSENLNELLDFWSQVADLFKDNNYVWFNIYNEPGDMDNNNRDQRREQWVTMHQEAIKLIRDEIGANNMIVVGGWSWGQDTGPEWDTNKIATEKSAILSAGDRVIAFDPGYGDGEHSYDNIIFDVHIYDQWDKGTQKEQNARLADYIDRVHAKGLPLIIGEYAADTDKHQTATKAVHAVAPKKGVGRIIWSFREGTRGDLLCKDGECAVEFDANDQPTNLTWVGELVWADNYGLNTAVDDRTLTANDFQLAQNYPNPFNPTTRITFKLPKTEHVLLQVFDVRGRLVETVVNSIQSAGNHSVSFNGTHLTSGAYFYKMIAGDFIFVRKMVLLQ